MLGKRKAADTLQSEEAAEKRRTGSKAAVCPLCGTSLKNGADRSRMMRHQQSKKCKLRQGAWHRHARMSSQNSPIASPFLQGATFGNFSNNQSSLSLQGHMLSIPPSTTSTIYRDSPNDRVTDATLTLTRSPTESDASGDLTWSAASYGRSSSVVLPGMPMPSDQMLVRSGSALHGGGVDLTYAPPLKELSPDPTVFQPLTPSDIDNLVTEVLAACECDPGFALLIELMESGVDVFSLKF